MTRILFTLFNPVKMRPKTQILSHQNTCLYAVSRAVLKYPWEQFCYTKHFLMFVNKWSLISKLCNCLSHPPSTNGFVRIPGLHFTWLGSAGWCSHRTLVAHNCGFPWLSNNQQSCRVLPQTVTSNCNWSQFVGWYWIFVTWSVYAEHENTRISGGKKAEKEINHKLW